LTTCSFERRDRAWIHGCDGSRRALIVRRATGALKALRAALIPLRPRVRGFGLDRASASPVSAVINGGRSRA
jgi:hypothetical protein